MSRRDELVALVGHRVHLVRSREAGRLLDWAGRDLRGIRLLDVAGGDGYWAREAGRRGAHAVSIDLARDKARRGARLDDPPGLVVGDALSMPVATGSIDVVLSVCAIEHFDDGPAAVAEMSRVLRPGGRLLLSADALSDVSVGGRQRARHVARYHVVTTYDHVRLGAIMTEAGLRLLRHEYLFQTGAAQRLYLGISAYGGRAGWNAAAPLAPLVALSDRRGLDQGSVVLVEAVKDPALPS